MTETGQPEKDKYYKLSGIDSANFVGMVARHSKAVGFLDTNHDAPLDKFFIKPNVAKNLAENGVTDFGTEMRPDKEDDRADIEAGKKYTDRHAPDQKVVNESLSHGGKYNRAVYSVMENNGINAFAGDTSKGYEKFEEARSNFRDNPSLDSFKELDKQIDKRTGQDTAVGKAMNKQAEGGKLATWYGSHHSDKKHDIDEATGASTVAIADKTKQQTPGADPISESQYDEGKANKMLIKSNGREVVKPPAPDKADSVVNANNGEIYVSGQYMQELQKKGVKFDIKDGYQAEFKGDTMHDIARGMQGVRSDGVQQDQGSKERPGAGTEQSAGRERR
jgi:hypothetical protein